MSKASKIDLTPAHLKQVRMSQKAGSIGRARDALAKLTPEERACISIAELARRSGLAPRTLTRPYVRPVVEAALGRTIGTGPTSTPDSAPLIRQNEALRHRLAKVKRLREQDREEMASMVATITELRRLVDLLSREAREDVAKG